MLNQVFPQSWCGLLRFFCFEDRYDATINGLVWLVAFFVMVMLYLSSPEDDSPLKPAAPFFVGACFCAAAFLFAIAFVRPCVVIYDEPENSGILQESCKRCYSSCERSQREQPQQDEINAELDASDGSARIKCFSCLKSNDQRTSVSTPENIPKFSTDPSGECLPRGNMEMAALNPEQHGPSQVPVGVTASEEQTRSESDSADRGTNLEKDGEVLMLNPEQQEQSPFQQAPVGVSHAADSCQDSDVQEPTEKQRQSRTDSVDFSTNLSDE